MILRIVSGLFGLLFVVQGLGWLFDPAAAAQGLGMPLLDGLARSTQVGDFAAFFVALGTLIGIGVVRSEPTWLYSASLLLGGAAVGRTLTWLLHDAPFAIQFIGIETVVTLVVLVTATRLAGGASTKPGIRSERAA